MRCHSHLRFDLFFDIQIVPKILHQTTQVVLERKVKPIDRVGITVPAGVAPLSSSLYMNLVPALTAGVPDISIISSPKNNRIDPTILYTADFLGIRNVYKISGVQGIAALAFGTESVQAVDKIVGPGNIFVQTAKKFLYGTVGIDSLKKQDKRNVYIPIASQIHSS